jgi:hypothetical protein
MTDRRSFLVSAAALAGTALAQPILGTGSWSETAQP